MNERDMLDLLHRRYGQRSSNGGVDAPRFVCAEHVRNRAGFFDRKDGGVEVKVSRSDWVRELADPAKASETLEYASHCWLAVPDASMVRDGELPAGWGLLCPAGIRGLIAKVAPVPRQPEPLTPSAVAALLRAAVKTAVARERRGVEADRESQLFDLDPDTDAEPDDGALFGTEEAS